MENNTNNSIIGVSLSGNTILCGKVKNGKLTNNISKKFNNKGSEEEILTELVGAIKSVFDDEVTGIGIGVPSLVDVENGIVYDVQKIPSWREVHLKNILENHFGVKVYVNNDANCFVIGEKYFGKAKDYENVLGLVIGTGVGAGIVFKGHLYSGTNCGAGELGSLPYREYDFEHYCSKSYFELKYGMTFELSLKRALNKDKIALAIFEQYGFDLGNLIKTILFTTDPEIIILGGTIAKAFPFFEKTMLNRVKTFIYKHSLKKLKITPSQQAETAIFGAVALFFDAQNTTLKK